MTNATTFEPITRMDLVTPSKENGALSTSLALTTLQSVEPTTIATTTTIIATTIVATTTTETAIETTTTCNKPKKNRANNNIEILPHPATAEVLDENVYEVYAVQSDSRQLISARMHVNNVGTPALIDSGANTSLMTFSFAQKCKLQWDTNNRVSIRYGNHSNAYAYGPVTAVVQFRAFAPDMGVPLQFFITDDLAHPVILGNDLLPKLEAKIDYKVGTLSLLSRSQPIAFLNPPAARIDLTLESNDYIDPDDFFVCNAQRKPSVEDLLCEFDDIVGSDTHVGRTNVLQHRIQMKPDAPPIFSRPYRVPHAQWTEMQQHIDTLLQQGIIRSSNASYASPAFLVPKKNNKSRMVVDYRKINMFTLPPRFPLPRSDDLIQRLGQSCLFSQLDLNSGYHQVEMHPTDIAKTSFVTPWGQYEFLRMPFGLSGAPMTFQRLMSQLLQDLPFVKVYLDDVLIHSKNFTEHVSHLRTVFERIRDAGLTINKEKSAFCQKQVTYLGFQISHNLIKPAPRNLESLKNIPMPKNRRGVRKLLGSFNFFRSMVPNMSARLAEITKKTSDSKPFFWSDNDTRAVQSVLDDLVHRAHQRQPDFEKPFQLYTDASNTGIGAILAQDNALIACYSAKLAPAQTRYTTTEQETLAIIIALKHWRHLLFGQQVEIFTDHSNLEHLSTSPLQRVQRWKLILDEFNPTIKYIPEHLNLWADFLSRNYIEHSVMAYEAPSTPLFPLDRQYLIQQQAADSHCQDIVRDKQLQKQLGLMLNSDKHLVSARNTHALFVPSAIRMDILSWIHDTARHPGISKTYFTLSARVYWSTMHADIAAFINECQDCAQVKPSKQYGILTPPTRASHPWHTVAIDILGPISFPGEKEEHDVPRYCLTVIDTFSRWCELIPLQDITAARVARLFDSEWLCRYPRPEQVVSDNGTQFVSAEFQELLDSYSIKQVLTSTYNPQGNSICERLHGFINNALRIAQPSDWTQELPAIAWSLRTTYHSQLKTSPSFLVFGTDMLDASRRSSIIRNISEQQSRSAEQVQQNNDRLNANRIDHVFSEKEYVFVKNPAPTKYQRKYEGPFEIIKVYPERNLCKLRYHDMFKVVPFRRLKPFLKEKQDVVKRQVSFHDLVN
jgi:transposase InsO family protein